MFKLEFVYTGINKQTKERGIKMNQLLAKNPVHLEHLEKSN